MQRKKNVFFKLDFEYRFHFYLSSDEIKMFILKMASGVAKLWRPQLIASKIIAMHLQENQYKLFRDCKLIKVYRIIKRNTFLTGSTLITKRPTAEKKNLLTRQLLVHVYSLRNSSISKRFGKASYHDTLVSKRVYSD